MNTKDFADFTQPANDLCTVCYHPITKHAPYCAFVQRCINPIKPTRVRQWIIEFHPQRHIIPPNGKLDLRNGSMVNSFRPLSLMISTVPKARLTIELQVQNQIFPFGCCDGWERKAGQLSTAFIANIIGSPTLQSSESVLVRIHNRYQKLPTAVSVQINGVYLTED